MFIKVIELQFGNYIKTETNRLILALLSTAAAPVAALDLRCGTFAAMWHFSHTDATPHKAANEGLTFIATLGLDSKKRLIYYTVIFKGKYISDEIQLKYKNY